MKTKLFFVVCGMAVFIGPHAYGAQKQQVTHYCLREKIPDYKDMNEADLLVKQTKDGVLVTFYNKLADAGQVLVIDDAPTNKNKKGDYEFKFDDGWGNEGAGNLHLSARTAKVSVDVTKNGTDSTSADAQRLYGDYTLATKACAIKGTILQ